MKTLNFFSILILACFTLSCATISTNYDYNPETDFSALRTFDFIPLPDDSEISMLDFKRFEKAITETLEEKGFERAAENPDFLIAAHLTIKDKINVTNWGYDYGPHYRRWGTGGVDVRQYEEGTLVLDFVKPHDRDLFWRGEAKGEIRAESSPQKRQEKINCAVRKILKNFPPNAENTVKQQ